MKLIKKLLIVSAGIAFSIGGSIAGLSIANKKAEAKIATTDTIGKTALSSVTDGQYVVIGTTNSNCVFNIESDWLKLSSTKTDWIKFQVETTTDGFYLKNSDTSSYLYSSADKKATFSTTSKTVLKLNGSNHLTGTAGQTSVIYSLGTSGIRPYKASQGTDASLYSVSSATLTDISVKTAPNKTSYKEGEKFDPTGLVLTATYSDGTTGDITTGYTYSPTEALKSTDTTVTITYGGQTTTQAITVADITSLSFIGTPNKLVYFENETFDPTGLTVTATYSDSSSEDVTEDVVWSKLVKGQTSVTGTFGGKTITVNGLTIKACSAFTKITESSQLSAGSKVLVVSSDSIVAGAFVETSANKGFFEKETADVNDGMITPSQTTMQFGLDGNSTDGWTLSNEGKYLAFTGAGNQNISFVETEKGSLTANHKFTISINNGVATISNKGQSGRALRYNDSVGTERFSNYASTSGQNVSLYSQSGSVDETITGVSLDKTEKQTLAINNSLSLTATVSGGDEADKTVTWSSSTAGVVTLSSTTTNTITVTAAKAGTTTVTATSNGDDSYAASIDIEVQDPNTVTSVSISNGAEVEGIAHVNNSKTLTATVLPEIASNKTVTWSSSDTSVATIATNGEITSIKPGVTTITATSVLTPSVKDEIPFIVYQQKGTTETARLIASDMFNACKYNTWPEDVDSNAQADDPNGIYYFEGIVSSAVTEHKSNQYSFTLTDAYGAEVTLSKAVSTDAIATGDTIEGNIDITNASFNDGVATIAAANIESVKSIPVPVTNITVNGTASVKVGNKTQLSVSLTPSWTTQRTVTWSTSASDVATVDANTGLVTGVSEGNAVITATSTDNPSIKGTLNITVISASSVEGEYTLTSKGNLTGGETPSYYMPFNANVNGIDESVFGIWTVGNISFDTNHENQFAFNDGANVSFTLNSSDYVISEVVVNGYSTGLYSQVGVSDDGENDYFVVDVNKDTKDSTYHLYPFANQVYLSGSGTKMYISSITLVVTTVTNETALLNTYAECILNGTAASCNKLNVTKTDWDNIECAFDALVINCDFDENAYSTITADQSGDIIAQAMARYDYIFVKYGASLELSDFLSRGLVPNPSTTINIANSSALLITAIATLTTVSLFGIYLLLKKKKEN